MAMVSVKEKFMLLVVVCIAALVPGALSVEAETNVPGLLPFEPGKRGGINCLSVITKVPGCLSEIYAAVLTDEVVIISSACCKAINKFRHTNCNPKIFPPSPSSPKIPPVSRSSCPALADILNSNSKAGLDLPGLLPPKRGSEIAKCWSNLTEVVGCVSNVQKALTSGQFGRIGGACCRAIEKIQDSCWPVMFPLQPSFQPLLKGFCTSASEPSVAILH